MGFEFWPAVVAGFAGGLVMSAMMVMMRKAGKTEMDMALLQGAMFTGDRGKARAIGLFTHLVMMSALVFGTLYALLFALFDTSAGNAWWVGALIGVVHGLVAGMSMAMMPAVHPRMRAEAAVGPGAAHSLELGPPGPFARNYGSATPPGVMVAHVMYGLVVGLVYALLAS
ncbi:hypothetical protein [Streptomyces atacamensis]|jgi:hypothetical protein|uniref:hypothetical protein n=1 Tax=Streptomyces atacamensis TaxID=531966 RepID=UPI00399C9470